MLTILSVPNEYYNQMAINMIHRMKNPNIVTPTILSASFFALSWGNL